MHLPFFLLLLIADITLAHDARYHLRRTHTSPTSQPRSLARDLRVAFGGILLPRDTTSSPEKKKPVVYCKPVKQAPFNNGNTGGGPDPDPTTTNIGGNSTATRSSSSTQIRGSSSTRRPQTTPQSTRTPTPVPSSIPNDSPWRLANSYSGNSFFEGWDFFTLPDPTHGLVDYIDERAARAEGLLEVNRAGNAIMRVETTQNVPGNRKSVRITSKVMFNGGLVVLDAIHMPTGCGTWPAFWTNGPNWPTGGEIDILEAVHDYTNNQATLHTAPGCTLASTDSNTLAISGSVIAGTDCGAETTGNRGCGIRSASSNSYGSGFNAVQGGVYALKWDTTGLAIYFFQRGSIPEDLVAEKPQPDTWGRAQARWPAVGCDPWKYFFDHHMIFDTTLCGDWAGAVWNGAGVPGQEESCAARTGFATCDEFVRARGDAFNNAYWEIRSVKLYQLRDN